MKTLLCSHGELRGVLDRLVSDGSRIIAVVPTRITQSPMTGWVEQYGVYYV